MDKIYKLLSDKNRRKIVRLLSGSDLRVTDILSNFSISQATLSSHLSKMRSVGLVGFNKKGREKIYFVNKKMLIELVEAMIGEYDLGIVGQKQRIDLDENLSDFVTRR